jgi:hypothetical protein
MELVKAFAFFAAPEPCKFVNFFFDLCVVLRCWIVKYAHSLVENLLNYHIERTIILVMRI